ncbi:MAG: SpoIID/LytB domain-containing protein [Nitrospiraceae bacterium]|nr:SpoIID/LytB domain-containing protein [Nitrospiraceae bacterium]
MKAKISMRAFFVFLGAVLMFIAASPGLARAVSIRVLILADEFKSIPAPNEKLKLLDKELAKLLVGDRPYSGDVEVWRGENSLYLIDSVDLEDYVKSVVKAETGSNWALEALKAQAVASRTYALYQMQKNKGLLYDVTSSVLNQVYRGDIHDDKVEKAVDETAGQILVYGGQPIEALYHSTCGNGTTEDPAEVFGFSVPYLKPVTCDCDQSPYYSWARKFPVSQIENATGVGDIKDIKIASHTDTGRVKALELDGGNGPVMVNATDLRRMLGWQTLPSTEFQMDFTNGYMDLEGSGYGHGVGMCQWSSQEMARAGKNYTDILSHFYPGASLVNSDGVPAGGVQQATTASGK